MNRKMAIKYATYFLLAVCLGCGSADQTPDGLKADYRRAFVVKLKNPADVARPDEVVKLDVAEIAAAVGDFNAKAFVVLRGSEEVPSQANDLNGDGKPDQIVLRTDFQPDGEQSILVRFAASGAKSRTYPKRTQAELSRKFGGHFDNKKYVGGAFKNVHFIRVPPEHTDHSEFFRYEGPGWESDKIGYRFYLDWRNGIDIFGKKVSEMVLQNVGLDGFDSYHEMSDWGMDILKVGESLGIGSIGMWQDGQAERVSVTDSVTCEIVANGPVYSQIRTRYFGWKVGGTKYDLTSNLAITAGHRMTEHNLTVSGHPENLCTGIVKLQNSEVLQPPENDGGWTYFATYGKQSLADDHLGMAVLYKRADLLDRTEDEYSHVLVLRPDAGNLTYYFLGAWEQEPDGIRTKAEFEHYLNQSIQKLNTPITVELNATNQTQ